MESSTTGSSSYDEADNAPILSPLYNQKRNVLPQVGSNTMTMDTPISVVDEFQVLYQLERSIIDRKKSEKEAKEVRLRSLMASVTESEAAVAIIRNDVAKSLEPRKKVSFSQQEEVFLEQKKQASTPTENLRKFLVEDDDAISEITDNHTVGSNRSHYPRSKADIPRTPASVSNVVIAAEEEWVPQDQPMFQIKRSPANEQSKRMPLSKDELERQSEERQSGDITPCDDSTVTNDLESQQVEYTERLHSGYSLSSSSNSSHLRGLSSLSTEGTSSHQVGYTQISTSDTSSLWKDSTSSSLGALATHAEEESEDALGTSLQLGYSLEKSFVEDGNQPGFYRKPAAEVDPWSGISGDVSDSAQSFMHSDAASTFVNSDDAVVNSLPSTDTIGTLDSAYQASVEQQANRQANLDTLELGTDTASATFPSDASPEETAQGVEPSSQQASKSKKKKKKSQKKRYSQKEQAGSVLEDNDVSLHTSRSTETDQNASLMAQSDVNEFLLQKEGQRERFRSDKCASDTFLMSREHQIATGRIGPVDPRQSKSDPTFDYHASTNFNFHASTNVVAEGIPVVDEESPSRFPPIEGNSLPPFHGVTADFSTDGVSALTGDHSQSLGDSHVRNQGLRGSLPRDGFIGSFLQWVMFMYHGKASSRNGDNGLDATRYDLQQRARGVTPRSDDSIADDEEYRQWSADTSPGYSPSLKSRKVFWCMVCLLLFLAFIIPISIFSSRQNDVASTLAPSVAPITPMTREEMIAYLSSVSNDNGAALQYDGTPQFRAGSWLFDNNNDPSIVSTESQLVQRYALATIFFSLGGEEWERQDKWMTTDHERSWFSDGESVFQGERLVNLNLSFNGLKGEIPGEIGLLSELTSINLSGNMISGFPESLSMLRNSLKLLKLNDNQLSGSLPSDVGSLPYLEVLDLSVNQLTGTIPTEIGRNTNMKEISLLLNDLFGPIPSEIGKLSLLRELDIRGNTISGFLPVELFTLRNLEHLSVADNRMIVRELSTEIGMLTQLTTLSMKGCGVSGAIPSQIGELRNVKSMWLQDNSLTGSIPATIARASSLVSLDLSVNGLTGVIPSEIGLLKNLETLFLQRNSLNGTIPVELSNVKSFKTHFNFQENNFTGSVPLELCQQSCCAHGEILVDIFAVSPCETNLKCLTCAGEAESVSMESVPEDLIP